MHINTEGDQIAKNKELFDEFGETISCKAEYEDLKEAMLSLKM